MKTVTGLLFFILLSSLYAEYPLIRETSAFRDPLFRQQQKETESWYYNQARNIPAPPLTIYKYIPHEDDTLIQLAAAFNLTIDSIATLNNFENIHDFTTSQVLIIPSAPGIYFDTDKESNWQKQLADTLEGKDSIEITLTINDKKKSIRYYSGAYLPDQMRLRFVKHLFLPPLDDLYITSPYGYRDHPFTGQWELHVGTDYRAPVGTLVKSCSDGRILSSGELEDYGKFVIIQHRNGYTSIYGHLSRILVHPEQEIQEGEVIGQSGNTGYSTGPHLHFEIRKNGSPQNPENLLTKSGK